MGKEDNILRKVGTQNPFRVPENYFEDFRLELMNKLPEKESIPSWPELTVWQRVKPWLYMAAMFVGIMLSVRIFVDKPQDEEFPITQVEAEMLPEEEWENMIRRTLVDDYAIYEYLTEANYNH
jgi:hypothetical protein